MVYQEGKGMIFLAVSCMTFSFLISFLLCRYLLANADKFRKGRRVYSERIKLHTKGVPRLGGIAIYGAFFITLLYFYLIKKIHFQDYNIKLLGILLASTSIMAVGLYDDLVKRLSYKIKFASQILAVIIVIILGYNVEIITNPLGGNIHIGVSGILFVLLWILAITNAMNLIDGLDGLACGISAIVGLSFFIVALHQDNIFCMLVAASIIGANLAFLKYNFYPARLFLGDSGSLFLGFILSILAIESYTKRATVVSMVVPLLTLFIPVSSVVFTFSRRIASAKNPFKPDRMHLHYRFLRAGVSHRDTVLIYLSATLIYTTLGTFCFFMPKRFELAIIAFAALTMLCLYMWALHFLKLKKGDGPKGDTLEHKM